MGMFLIISGAVLFIMSLLLLLVTPSAIIFILISLFLIYNGRKINKEKKLKKNIIENQEITKQQTGPLTKEKGKHFTFRVAGITKTNDDDENIQKLISEYVKEQLDPDEVYEGLSNKEILEDYYDDRVYELSDLFIGTDEIKLEFEPSNPYDSNAIKVINEDMGHIGYVPKVENIKVAEIMQNSEYHITAEIIGGKYKYVNQDEDKVKIQKDSYGIEIEIAYE